MDIAQWRKKSSDLSLGSSHGIIYSKAVELIEKHKCGQHFLDFGAGQGQFVSQVLGKNFFTQYTALDLMERPSGISEKIEWVSRDLNEKVDLPEASVDIISSLEVIEHLENPRHVMREIYRLLKPNGILLLSTPNNESWRAIISYCLRGHFVAFTDTSYPAHITALNRKDLLRVSEEAGFEFIEWAYTNRGSVPGVTQLTWQGLSLSLLGGLRYSDNLLLILRKKA